MTTKNNNIVMDFLRAVHEWKMSGCSSLKTVELRSLINQNKRSQVAEDHQQQIERLLKRIDLFAIYINQNESFGDNTSIIIENFRLLRDVTCNKDAQEQAINSGALSKALELICLPNKTKDSYDLQRVLLGFIANCSSFPRSWEIIHLKYDFDDSINVHPDCAAMTAYNVYVLPNSPSDQLQVDHPEPPFHFCQIIPKALLESELSADAQFWLSEVLEAIIRKKKGLVEVLQWMDEATLIELIKNDYIFTDESMERNVDLLALFFQAPFSIAKLVLMAKFAQFTCNHSLKSTDAENMLRLAVTEMKQMGPGTQTDDEDYGEIGKTTGMWLRIIANILNQAETEAKILFREIGGIPILLANTNLDVNHPTKREWALFAIRGLCENNPDAQEYIANLQIVKAEEMQHRANVIHTTL